MVEILEGGMCSNISATQQDLQQEAPVIKLAAKQQEVFNLAMEGKNISLSGKAGTGKSFIVKHIIEDLRKAGKKIAAVAPTGIAANNIGGQTIHSMFSIAPFGIHTYKSSNFLNSEKRRMLKAIDVLVIDEVSMLRPDILDCINWTLKKSAVGSLSDKQVIFVGDLKQLPVIMDDNERSILYQSYSGEEFFNANIYKVLDPVVIELDEVLRQTDEEFITNLNIVRDGGKSEYFRQFLTNIADEEGIILAPHNSTVKAYNEAGLAKLQGELYEFKAEVTGKLNPDEFNVESLIKVRHGAKIMYLANSINNPLRNGTLGTFIVNNGMFFIKVEGVEYALEPMKFTKMQYVYDEEKDLLEMKEMGVIVQYPIRLAYALSIHKSQGLTFDKVSIDLSLPCFAKGQQYVALSRVTSPAGLKIVVNR